MATQPVLELRGVRKSYGELVAVDLLDLEVQPGECVALIGHNGSGKWCPIPAIGNHVASGIMRARSRPARNGNIGSALPWITSDGTFVSRSFGRRSGVAMFTPQNSG